MEPGLIILLLLLVPFTSYFGNQARYIKNDFSCALSELAKDRQPRAGADLSAELMDSAEVSVELRRTTATPKSVLGVLRSIRPVATIQTTSRPSRRRRHGFSESVELDSAPAFRSWSDTSVDTEETRFSTSEISLESDSDEIGQEFKFARRPRRERRGLVRVAVFDES